MKAKLEFNLNDPEDAMAHKRCVKALDMALVLFEIQNNMIKYVESILPDTNLEPAHVFRDKVDRLLEAHGINIEELVL